VDVSGQAPAFFGQYINGKATVRVPKNYVASLYFVSGDMIPPSTYYGNIQYSTKNIDTRLFSANITEPISYDVLVRPADLSYYGWLWNGFLFACLIGLAILFGYITFLVTQDATFAFKVGMIVFGIGFAIFFVYAILDWIGTFFA
jgi:hypothetical protein